jgi:hypothetical protein
MTPAIFLLYIGVLNSSLLCLSVSDFGNRRDSFSKNQEEIVNVFNIPMVLCALITKKYHVGIFFLDKKSLI